MQRLVSSQSNCFDHYLFHDAINWRAIEIGLLCLSQVDLYDIW